MPKKILSISTLDVAAARTRVCELAQEKDGQYSWHQRCRSVLMLRKLGTYDDYDFNFLRELVLSTSTEPGFAAVLTDPSSIMTCDAFAYSALYRAGLVSYPVLQDIYHSGTPSSHQFDQASLLRSCINLNAFLGFNLSTPAASAFVNATKIDTNWLDCKKEFAPGDLFFFVERGIPQHVGILLDRIETPADFLAARVISLNKDYECDHSVRIVDVGHLLQDQQKFIRLHAPGETTNYSFNFVSLSDVPAIKFSEARKAGMELDTADAYNSFARRVVDTPSTIARLLDVCLNRKFVIYFLIVFAMLNAILLQSYSKK
jgi:hypothetical protein